MRAPTGLLGCAAGVLAALTLSLPAAAATSVFVEANPSTVSAGDEIGLRASCKDNLTAATVTSDAFGKVTVSPRYGFLTATASVPTGTRPGDYRVRLTCPDGSSATNTVHVLGKVRPSRGPATGGGGTAGGRSAPMLLGGGLTALAGGLVLGFTAVRRRRAH